MKVLQQVRDSQSVACVLLVPALTEHGCPDYSEQQRREIGLLHEVLPIGRMRAAIINGAERARRSSLDGSPTEWRTES